jgi:sporulation protein YlmC with PRC-barrel domain
MASDENKKYSKQIISKTVVSKTGKRFGEVGDINFETRTGELLQIILKNPTSYTEDLELERSKAGELIIPFSAVIAIGDFVVVAEEDII